MSATGAPALPLVVAYVDGGCDPNPGRGAYAAREGLPTDSTIGALTTAYRPRAYQRDELQPSPVAIRARKERERQQNARRAAALGSRVR